MKLAIIALIPMFSVACGSLTVEKDGTKVTWSESETEEQSENNEEEGKTAFSLVIDSCSTLESESVFLDESLHHFVLTDCDNNIQLHKITSDKDLNEIDRTRVDGCLDVKSFNIYQDFNSVEITCSDDYKEIVELSENSAQTTLINSNHNKSTLADHTEILLEKSHNINSLFVNSEDVYTIYKGSLQPFSCMRHKNGFEEKDVPIRFDNGFSSNDDFAANANHYLRYDSYTSSFEFGYFEDCKPIRKDNTVDMSPQKVEIDDFVSFSINEYSFIADTIEAKELFIVNNGQVKKKYFKKDSIIHINKMEQTLILNNKESIEFIRI